jgi:hypothetical protein
MKMASRPSASFSLIRNGQLGQPVHGHHHLPGRRRRRVPLPPQDGLERAAVPAPVADPRLFPRMRRRVGQPGLRERDRGPPGRAPQSVRLLRDAGRHPGECVRTGLRSRGGGGRLLRFLPARLRRRRGRRRLGGLVGSVPDPRLAPPARRADGPASRRGRGAGGPEAGGPGPAPVRSAGSRLSGGRLPDTGAAGARGARSGGARPASPAGLPDGSGACPAGGPPGQGAAVWASSVGGPPGAGPPGAGPPGAGLRRPLRRCLP